MYSPRFSFIWLCQASLANHDVYFQLGYDVFNALDLLDNASFFEDLKFGIGDGNLHYYLYNWRCPTLKPEEVSSGILKYRSFIADQRCFIHL